MSHLSILPTVFTRMDLLEAALLEEGFLVSQQSDLEVFEAQPCRVDLLAQRPEHRPIGWRRSGSGAITMIGDLQRMSLQPGLGSRLQNVTTSPTWAAFPPVPSGYQYTLSFGREEFKIIQEKEENPSLEKKKENR